MPRLVLALSAGVALGVSSPACAVGHYLLDRGQDVADCVRVEVGVGPGIGVNVHAAGLAQAGLVVASVPRRAAIGWDYGRPSGVLGPAPAAARGPTALPPAAWVGWDGEVSASAVTWAVVVAISAAAKGSWAVGALPAGVAGMGAGPRSGGDAPRVPSGLLALTGFWETSGAPHPSVARTHESRSGLFALSALTGTVGRRGHASGQPAGASRLWSPTALAGWRRAHVHAFDLEARAYAGLVYARAGVSVGELVDLVAGCFGADLARDDGRWKG